MSINLQSDKKETKQVRLDKTLHKELKIESSRRGITISGLLNSIVESFLTELKTPSNKIRL